MLSANEIRGLYAILPTPAKPGAEHILARDTVDLDETARAVEALIADGCDGLIALGTTGECATLSQEDYDAFVACLVDTTRKRVPLFVGTTALAGYEVARRMRLVSDLGADGTLLGLPMWQPVTVDAAVRYYRELSEGFPALAIMVYANTRAFRFTDHLEAGMIWVNSENVRHLPTPFGGVKNSGIGRDGGDYSFDFYMETKNVCLAKGTHKVPKLGV